MKNTKVLEMLNNGQLEELKALLQDEIFTEGIANTSGAKKRYSAMKRYFKFKDRNAAKSCQVPCMDINVHGERYNSFVDGYSVVLTKESIGELESYDNSKNDYFKMDKMIDFSSANSIEKVNINKILAEAKANGYKYKMSEIASGEFTYYFRYKEGFYKVGILDQAYSIINDGEEAEVYYSGAKNVLLIKTSIGIAGILPFYHNNANMNGKILIGA